MLYNPQNIPESEFLRGFVVRQQLLRQLLDDLRRAGPMGASQHHLLLGQRGLGKTTLLRRLALAIRDDQGLSSVWQPLSFPEEQYNVAGLKDFWLNCADALSEAFDQAGRASEAAALDRTVDQLSVQAAPSEALAILRAESERIGRRLVLLVDNLDLILDRLGPKEEWALRTALSEAKYLTVIGASSRTLEAFYSYDRAFYDFFQVHELKGLDDDEAFALLQQMAEQAKSDRVQKLLVDNPGRVRALRLLTGGNPRTMALLFRVLEKEDGREHSDGETMQDLEQLLDLYTPLYKARFEDLSDLGQRVVDAMAIHWDPITAGDLAERMALKVNLVSAQLDRLVSSGVLEKVPWFGEKKTGFQLAERFFNIWYLMRASRRVRKGLVWYVKFLETFFREDELRARAEKHLCDNEGAQRDPERYAALSLAYAQAFFDDRLAQRLEHAGLRAAMAVPDRIRDLIDFRDLPPALLDKKARMERMASLAKAVRSARADWGGIDPGEFWKLLGGSPRYEFAEKVKIVQSLGAISLEALQEIYSDLEYSRKRIARHYMREQESVDRLYAALASGELEGPFDWKTAVAIANDPSLAAIAIATRVNKFLSNPTSDDIRLAEKACLEMSEYPDLSSRSQNILGNILQYHHRRYDEAEVAYHRAIELDSQFAYPWINLGDLLQYRLTRFNEAEAAYRRAIQLDPHYADPWSGLGNLLQDQLSRFEEAEAAYRRAIELDPLYADPWSGLGNLFQNHFKRYDDAEAAYRRAIELDPLYADPWNGLGNLFQDHFKRYDDAEAAYRRAIKLDPESAVPLYNLGRLLLYHLSRCEEAEAAYRRAIELEPGEGDHWNGLGCALQEQPNRTDEAEAVFRRAIELDAESVYPWSNLGRLYSGQSKALEAAEALLHAVQLDRSRIWDQDLLVKSIRTLGPSPTAFRLALNVSEVLPESATAQLLPAEVLMSQKNWISATERIRPIAANPESDPDAWNELALAAVRNGFTAELRQLLEETGAHERWRPLYEALRAVEAGTEDYLRRVSPEVRFVARQIYRRLNSVEG